MGEANSNGSSEIKPDAATGRAAAVMVPKKPCCRKLLRIFRSEALLVTISILFVVAMSAAVTIGLQLYSLTHPPKSTYRTSPSELQMEYEDVTIPTSDPRITVAGWFIPAKNGSDSVILALPGYGSNRSEVLPRVGFLSARFNLLVIDLRYFGDTTGDFTTLGLQEMTEVRAAMSWLEGRGYSDIGLYGMSLGGGLALMSLAEWNHASCAVVESPFVDLRLVVKDSFRNFGSLADAATDGALAMAQVFGVDAHGDYIYSRVSGLRKPVLVIRPMLDEVVSSGHIDQLQQSMGKNANAEYWFLPDKGYGELGDDFAGRVGLFFEGCLFGGM